MDRWRAWAKDLLPWGALAAFTGIAVAGDVGPEMKELLLKWGPGLLIFLVIVQHAPAFVRAAQTQADAMVAMARELQDLPQREDLQELLLGQEALRRETVATREEVLAVRRDLNGRTS